MCPDHKLFFGPFWQMKAIWGLTQIPDCQIFRQYAIIVTRDVLPYSQEFGTTRAETFLGVNSLRFRFELFSLTHSSLPRNNTWCLSGVRSSWSMIFLYRCCHSTWDLFCPVFEARAWKTPPKKVLLWVATSLERGTLFFLWNLYILWWLGNKGSMLVK